MSKPDDGGPAFPRHVAIDFVYGAEQRRDGHEGMSLRDWLAGQAISGMIDKCQGGDDEEWLAEVALKSYQAADAMLKEREKRY